MGDDYYIFLPVYSIFDIYRLMTFWFEKLKVLIMLLECDLGIIMTDFAQIMSQSIMEIRVRIVGKVLTLRTHLWWSPWCMPINHRVGSDLKPFNLNHEVALINEYYVNHVLDHILNFTVGSTLVEVKFKDIHTLHERIIRTTRVLNRWILPCSSNLLTPWKC